MRDVVDIEFLNQTYIHISIDLNSNYFVLDIMHNIFKKTISSLQHYNINKFDDYVTLHLNAVDLEPFLLKHK